MAEVTSILYFLGLGIAIYVYEREVIKYNNAIIKKRDKND